MEKLIQNCHGCPFLNDEPTLLSCNIADIKGIDIPDKYDYITIPENCPLKKESVTVLLKNI